MKKYIGPLLKLLLLLAFISRIEFVFGQTDNERTVKLTSNSLSEPVALYGNSTFMLAGTANTKQEPLNLYRTAAITGVEAENLEQPISGTGITRASSLGDEIGYERLVLKASPKAFSSKTDLSFMLRQHSSYKLEILDVRGVLITVLAEGTGQKGEQFAFGFKKGKYAAGAYIGRLITEHEVTSARFVLE